MMPCTLILYRLRARYYDPGIGRFLTRDTWAYDYQNPFELNRYVYTANNPVTYLDPSGYQALVNRAQLDQNISIASKPRLSYIGKSWLVSVGGAVLGHLIGAAVMSAIASFVDVLQGEEGDFRSIFNSNWNSFFNRADILLSTIVLGTQVGITNIAVNWHAFNNPSPKVQELMKRLGGSSSSAASRVRLKNAIEGVASQLQNTNFWSGFLNAGLNALIFGGVKEILSDADVRNLAVEASTLAFTSYINGQINKGSSDPIFFQTDLSLIGKARTAAKIGFSNTIGWLAPEVMRRIATAIFY